MHTDPAVVKLLCFNDNGATFLPLDASVGAGKDNRKRVKRSHGWFVGPSVSVNQTKTHFRSNWTN